MALSTDAKPHATLILKTAEGEEMRVAIEQVNASAASQALGFPAAILDQLRRYDLIAGDGELIDLDDANRVVNELRAAMAPFIGSPILISEAAEKYGFNRGSVYKWVKDEWVKVLVPEPRRKVDEGDMVLAKELSSRQGHIPGRAVFPAQPRSGRPRKPR